MKLIYTIFLALILVIQIQSKTNSQELNVNFWTKTSFPINFSLFTQANPSTSSSYMIC